MTAMLVDEDISRDLVAVVIGQGYTAVHALDIGPKGQHDALLFLEAQRRHLVMFTLNRGHFVQLAEAWQIWD